MRTALLLTLTLLLTGCASRHPDSRPTTMSTPVESMPAAALRGWDEQRSAAYASGSASALQALYVAGSTAAAGDVAMLQQYAARGLVVTGMRTQVLAFDVVAQTPGELTLLVTDRLVGAVAHGPAGDTPLPHDQASTRQVVLRQVAGQWLVESVS